MFFLKRLDVYYFVYKQREWFPVLQEQVGEGLPVVDFEEASQQSVEGMVVDENYHMGIYCNSERSEDELLRNLSEKSEDIIDCIQILRVALDDMVYLQNSTPIAGRPFFVSWAREGAASVHPLESIHSRYGRVVHYT